MLSGLKCVQEDQNIDETRAENSLRSGVFHYDNITRTKWMIKSLKIVTYVLWLSTCCYMCWYCTTQGDFALE